MNHGNKYTLDLSIILPCLNEEKAIVICLDSIKRTLAEIAHKRKFAAEIIIVDNNSTDTSVVIIQKYKETNQSLNIILAEEKTSGYGSAYQKGILIAKGNYIFMADLDGTYDFADIPRFIEKLDAGFDLVVGNRFIKSGKTKNKPLGSMPWHHRYIGNPFLSAVVRLFFGVKIRDIHCGARAIRHQALDSISLYTIGMEFASEMIIKAAKAKMAITEIPIAYSARIGTSKLNSFRDGWRHLRFIFLYSPLIIFLLPGMILFILGLISMVLMYVSNPTFLHTTFNLYPMFISSGCMIVGYQLIYFAFFAKTYGMVHMGEKNTIFEKLFEYITLEKAGIIGLLLLLCGTSICISILYGWVDSGFDSLNAIKNSILALTLLIIGAQTISSAFMLSIIGIKR